MIKDITAFFVMLNDVETDRALMYLIFLAVVARYVIIGIASLLSGTVRLLKYMFS